MDVTFSRRDAACRTSTSIDSVQPAASAPAWRSGPSAKDEGDDVAAHDERDDTPALPVPGLMNAGTSEGTLPAAVDTVVRSRSFTARADAP